MATPVSFAPLNAKQRQAVFGVTYLSAIATQAGLVANEPRSGEDVMALDLVIRYRDGLGVDCQVKTTYQHAIDGTTENLRWELEEGWVEKWARLLSPTYFVIVVVPDDSASWLDHSMQGTLLHRTAAYWCRIDAPALRGAPSIYVPRTQRVDAGVVLGWHQDARASFDGVGS